MSSEKSSKSKLDPYSRMRVEDGLPSAGVDVTVRLSGADRAAAASQVRDAGLEVHAQVGDVVVGHVADSAALDQITGLACVQEVQVARPLYEDERRQ